MVRNLKRCTCPSDGIDELYFLEMLPYIG